MSYWEVLMHSCLKNLGAIIHSNTLNRNNVTDVKSVSSKTKYRYIGGDTDLEKQAVKLQSKSKNVLVLTKQTVSYLQESSILAALPSSAQQKELERLCGNTARPTEQYCSLYCQSGSSLHQRTAGTAEPPQHLT